MNISSDRDTDRFVVSVAMGEIFRRSWTAQCLVLTL